MKYYNLYCSKCRTHTKHKVTDDPDKQTQTIQCTRCDEEQIDNIIDKRNKLNKILGDPYEEWKRKQSTGTENTNNS